MEIVVTQPDIPARIEALQPKDYIVYHTGMLLRDRKYNVRLNQIARAVWDQYLKGNVTLVQKRLNPFSYEYRAVKLANVKPVAVLP